MSQLSKARYFKELYQERRKTGKCTICGRKRYKKNKTLQCTKCNQKESKNAKKRRKFRKQKNSTKIDF